MTTDAIKWIPVRPPFWEHTATRDVFLAVAVVFEDLIEEHEHVGPSVIRECREAALQDARPNIATEYQAVSLALHILGDLVSQGWQVRVLDQTVSVAKPERSSDREQEKQRVRRSLLLARDEQLTEPSVRAFVKGMEARQFGHHGWTSIFSLMRDGKELAGTLEAAAKAATQDERLAALAGAIQPYLQFVTEDARCERTGLRLADIWRYFRYTWLTPARSVPGRSMNILIRDAAVESHPVIGIAALSSSIVQQSQRDQLIGWDKDTILREVSTTPTDALAAWLQNALVELIDAIYTEDIATPEEIREPTPEVIERLTKLSVEEKEKHQIHADKLGYRQQQSATDWAGLMRLHLYRSKRSSTLAGLLWIRRAFCDAGFVGPTADHLREAVKKADFRASVSRLVRQVKASHVGINMMDISVAGAIAPYQAILGGKLVSLLLASPEVRDAYARRYGQMPSIIASAMKGQSVQRRPDLVLLCTTGLFAGGSSQYNRVRIPAVKAGGTHGEVRYQQLTTETEYATFHISQATMTEMKTYISATDKGATVNSIFGEGVNPKMRKISEGLRVMGFPPEEVLKAGSPRAIYMIALAHNYRDILLGRTDTPDYILPSDDPRVSTDRIADFWRARWLANRIENAAVLKATRRNETTYPKLHGATVKLPETDQEQFSFDDLLFDTETPAELIEDELGHEK
jgi:hypothetical protein